VEGTSTVKFRSNIMELHVYENRDFVLLVNNSTHGVVHAPLVAEHTMCLDHAMPCA